MSDFNRNPLIDWALKLYIALSFAFIFAPIAASFVFSLNVDRFPSLPLGATYNANIDRGLALFDREATRKPRLTVAGLRPRCSANWRSVVTPLLPEPS